MEVFKSGALQNLGTQRVFRSHVSSNIIVGILVELLSASGLMGMSSFDPTNPCPDRTGQFQAEPDPQFDIGRVPGRG